MWPALDNRRPALALFLFCSIIAGEIWSGPAIHVPLSVPLTGRNRTAIVDPRRLCRASRHGGNGVAVVEDPRICRKRPRVGAHAACAAPRCDTAAAFGFSRSARQHRSAESAWLTGWRRFSEKIMLQP
jgi:hypothetical protein